MEYTKNNEKFSFGFGTEKVAGKGNLLNNRQAMSGHSKKFLVKKAVTVGIQIIAVTAITKFKFFKK